MNLKVPRSVSSDLTVAPSEKDPSSRRRVNQRWYYEQKDPAFAGDVAVPVLSKRNSKPPQRLTASRFGMIACVPWEPGDSGLSGHSAGSSSVSRSSSSRAGVSRPGDLDSALDPTQSHDCRGQPPPSPTLAPGENVVPFPFTIRLRFPNGGAPTIIFPVFSDMAVTLLRREIATFLDVREVHLLVRLSWEHDLLEHTGVITARYFPGTSTFCPYVQQGSEVNVFFERPAADVQSFHSSALSLAVGGSLSFPLLVDSSESEVSEPASPVAPDDDFSTGDELLLPTEDELQTAWRVDHDRYGGDPALTDAENFVEWREYNRHGSGFSRRRPEADWGTLTLTTLLTRTPPFPLPRHPNGVLVRRMGSVGG